MATRWAGLQCSQTGGILLGPYHDLIYFLWADGTSAVTWSISENEVAI